MASNNFYPGSNELRLHTGSFYSSSNSNSFALLNSPHGLIIETKLRWLELADQQSALYIANTTNTAPSNGTNMI